MIIKNNLRPTAIRTNSRFRGPTELNNYSNFILETIHDLKLLGSVMDRNDFVEGHKGHTDFIDDNFAAYVSGNAPIVANINTASTLCSPVGTAIPDVNLLQTNWAAYGQCQKTGTKEKPILTSPGLLDPCGVGYQKLVEEGDIIYIRMGVKWLSGNNTAFSLGSQNINRNEGDMTRYEISKNGSTNYIDKRLYCKHREPITINIDVHNLPGALSPASFELSDIQILYLSENRLTVEPIDIVVKSRINNLESNIQNIINNL